MSEKSKKAVWDGEIIARALADSLRKLDPRRMMRSPVMFVVEVGSVVTTLLLVRDVIAGLPGVGFSLQITLWLWFTVLFANFAEAMAEGRGKAQADSLRKAKTETTANRLLPGGRVEVVAAPELRKGDVVVVSAGEFIPGDGEVVEGVASVDESAITGESRARHPRGGRRPLGGDGRHARAVRPDQGAHHVEPRRDFPRPHDRARRRRGAAEDAERDRA